RGAGVDRGVEPGAPSVGHAPPARIRPAPPPPRIPLPSSTRPAREPPPAPIAPPRIPSVSRRGPIPGTLADRTLRQLRDMGGGASNVSLPELCRRAWPPNPGRVHEALRELEATGLVELGAAPAAARASSADRDLLMEGPSGALLGVVRAR
ncbi:MAG TPA: hypothetical protein PLI95_22495, partial [Polyangiaceae bacterium]|nr:hypothetical protein [Polyangiaceae bacterium]